MEPFHSDPAGAPLIERLLSLVTRGRSAEAALLYSENALVELPLALPDPIALQGRAAIAAHLERASRSPISFTWRDLRVWRTGEIFVAEYMYDVTVRTGGPSQAIANVQILTLRDGLIAFSRDYHYHHRLMEILAKERNIGQP